MTTDGEESGQDSTAGEGYGGFVFAEESGDGGLTGGSALPSLEQRLAPIVALLVIVSLLLAGSYIAFTSLSGPSENVLGASGSADGSGGSGPSNGSASAPTSTDTGGATTTPAPSTVAAETTAPGTTGAPTTGERTTDQRTATGTMTDAPTAVETSTDTTTATPTPTDTVESTTTTLTATVTETATDTPTATDSTAMATATPENRSPSIDTLSTDRGEGDGSTVLTVDWAVADPDGDLETVEITVVEETDDGTQVVSRRTIAVGGSDDSGETAFTLDDATSGSTYEIRLVAEDEAGNTALAVTRDASDE